MRFSQISALQSSQPLPGSRWPPSLDFSWTGRHLFESAQGRSGGVPVARDNRQRRQQDGGGKFSVWGWSDPEAQVFWVGFPAPLAPAGFEWCPVDHFRRPRGLQRRDQPKSLRLVGNGAEYISCNPLACVPKRPASHRRYLVRQIRPTRRGQRPGCLAAGR